MTFPTLHLNGTSYDELFERADAACNTLYEAVMALRATAPNARDYYIQRGAAFAAAQQEHSDRVNRVSQALGEMQSLRENLMEQKNAREVRRS
jgi:hypothetical protein